MIRSSRVRSLVVFFVVGFLAGCASRKIDPNIHWTDRIGTYTYQQAVADLGRPDVVGGNADGGQNAEWIAERGPRLSFGFGVGGGSFSRHSGVGVGAGTSISPPRQVDFLRLNFGPDGRLVSWTRNLQRH